MEPEYYPEDPNKISTSDEDEDVQLKAKQHEPKIIIQSKPELLSNEMIIAYTLAQHVLFDEISEDNLGKTIRIMINDVLEHMEPWLARLIYLTIIKREDDLIAKNRQTEKGDYLLYSYSSDYVVDQLLPGLEQLAKRAS